MLDFLKRLFRPRPSRPTDSSEDRFHLLVEGIKDYAIFMLDPEGRVATWNAGAERIKKYSPKEIIGQHFSRFYPPEDIATDKPQRALQTAIETGKFEDEGWRLRKDGSRFWASVVLTALRDKTGTLRGFGKVTRDLTERKLAEENNRRLDQEEAARRAAEVSVREAQLAQREERRQREQLHVTLSSIGDAVIVTDTHGTVTFLNPVAVELTGWTPQEAAGRPVEEVFRIINEETRQPAENPVSKVLREGMVVGLANHTVLLHRNDSDIPIDDSAAPIRGEDGTIAGVVLVFRDVSEARRAIEGRLRLAAIVESSDDAIISESLEGIIVSWNKGAERLFGYTAEEVVGQPLSLLVPPDHPDELPAILEKLRRGERIDHFETVRVCKDGTRLDVSLTISPVKDASGRIVGGSKIARDISAAKRQALEISRLYDELREADRRKDEFLAMLSHELRNPLAPIRNALQIMKMPGAEAEAVEHARQMMERQVLHMVRLVDDLLDVSRIMRGTIVLRKEPIDLATVVAHAVETAQPMIDAQGQQVIVAIPPEPLWLEADPTRLAQVVGNLLHNAAKFSPRAGRIWLTAERQEGDAVLRIRDEGSGIAPDLLPHIFDLFVQGDRTLERSRGGMGIGLTVVRKLVQMHDGSVTAFSGGPGQGSEFTVRLPGLRDRFDPKPAPEHRLSIQLSRRILIVDDNVDAAESTALLLRMAGHEVRLAHSGPDALQAADTFQPQVVLLDIGLPGMNGYEVAQHLRRNAVSREALLIAVTGYGQEEDRQRSRDAGFDEHLTKPVEPETLQGLLASV